MPKDDPTKKDAAEKDKNAGDDKDETSGKVELEAVKSKKGEPDDTLRRRAEWFQKRTGGK